ncbi:MAG: DUF4097 family beta strand repeat protein [Acidimicrobiia bacterium]|nr:DUF4097 family beta strand repeat protein [Acidimicrobiia bacterium]
MTTRVETMQVGGVVTLDIANAVGDVVVRDADAAEVTVALSGDGNLVDGTSIDLVADRVTVRSPKTGRRFARRMDVTVTMPPGGVALIRVAAGSIRVRSRVTEAELETSAGDVRMDEPVEEVSIRVASGNVTLADVSGSGDIDTANGDVRIRAAGDVRVSTASGDIRVDEVRRTGRLKSASGDLTIGRFAGTDLDAKTMSGDVRVGIATRMELKASVKTLSGDFRNKIQPSPGEKLGSASLRVSSFSGDITLTSVEPPVGEPR